MKKTLQRQTPKFIYINNIYGQKGFKLLDIGAGNHSASKTKSLFPNCEYYGVDIDKNYNNDERDFEVMTAFYELDLTQLDFSSIPDNTFDFIRIAHVIEHLFNGDLVIQHLIPKLKKGGYIYIEYPGQKSTSLPSMYGTLNFYDDNTHVRIYSIPEIKQTLGEDFKIIKSGTRRNIALLAAMPIKAISTFVKGEKQLGSTFWDWYGFAEFTLAQKIK